MEDERDGTEEPKISRKLSLVLPKRAAGLGLISDAEPPSTEPRQPIQQKLTLKLSLGPGDSQKPTVVAKAAGHDAVSFLFPEDFSESLQLKPDHSTRPLWVCPDGRITLEAFSPLVKYAQDFLITIAEPVSRPQKVHEYRLTAYSLYAAVSVGMETETILQVLDRFSKMTLPERVVHFIKDCTMSYGKVKLVLKDNRYFIESSYPEILCRLLQDEIIQKSRVENAASIEQDKLLKKFEEMVKGSSSLQQKKDGESAEQDETFGAVITLDHEDELQDDRVLLNPDGSTTLESDFTQSVQIQKSLVEEVKRRCTELDYPLMEEYDFRKDDTNPNLEMDLSPKTSIRDYQEKSLSKMFGGGGGRARSGIIVLPTGAGKTLVGITAACTIKKSTLILCTNAIAVEQWANELRRWSTIPEGSIAKFTADNKTRFAGDAGIVISTYTMISHTGKRAPDSSRMLEFINSTEWGLLILDEVHVVPANVFRRVLTIVAAHAKLGLTATLVREDDKIEDLNFLIGPKLFEANWMDLAESGHIAKVEATEVWCPMTGDFYREYLDAKSGKRRLLCVMNPYKFMAAEYLIKWRESQGDKIMVFSDNVFALSHYAITLKKPFLYGQTSHEERQRILQAFRDGHPLFQTIFLSKIGDTSLDLPEATCLIQISSQFGSRRQEAQRMGRILRAKRRNEEGFKSRFYTLVSQDTDEVQFSAKRRSFLVDQGYEFKIISKLSNLIPENEIPDLHYHDVIEQNNLLELIKEQSDEVGQDEVIETGADDLAGVTTGKRSRANVAAPPKAGKSSSLFKAWKKGRTKF